ncbi:uncharacterized protein LOC135828034 [Sycon ciliatum]|uniref:uncharacterized protein LOC135828034 n=1 Tax=Sycon ciliatum TaxID=27933 RepID=UPI0031F6588D
MPRQRSRSHSRPQEESMARRVDGTSLLNPETKFSMDRNAISSAPGSLKGRESKGLRTRSRDRLNSVTSTLAATRDKVSQVRRFSMTSSRAASAASKPAHAVQRASLPVGVLEKLASLPLYLGDTQSCSLEQLYQATLDVLRCTGNNQLTSNGLFYVKECFRRADEQEEWSSDSRIEDFIPISLAVIKAKDIGPLLVKHPASRAGTAIKSQLFWRALVRPSQSQPSSSTSSSSTSSSFRAVREKQKLEEQISATHLYSHLMVDCEDSPEWDGSRVQLNVSNLLNEDLVLQIWRADDMKAGSEDSDVAMAATLGVEKTSSSRSRSSSLHKPRNVSELSSTKTSGGQNFRQRIRTLSSKSRLSRPVESLQKKTVTSLITEAILPLEGIQGRFHEVDKWLVATRTEGKDGKDGKATQASLPQIRMKARVLTDKAIPEVPGVSAVEVYLFTLETFLFHERHLALYQSQLSAAAAATAAGTSSQRASSHSVEGGGSGGSGTHTTSSSSSSNAGGMPVITSAELSETARYILQQVAALRGVTLKEEIWCQWLAGSKTLSTSGDIVLTSDGAQQTLYAARLLKENSQLVQSLPEAEVQAWKDSLESVAEGLLKHARHLAYKIILESGLDDWNSLLQCTKCIRAITELLLYRAWFPSMANCKTRVVGAVKASTVECHLSDHFGNQACWITGYV